MMQLRAPCVRGVPRAGRSVHHASHGPHIRSSATRSIATCAPTSSVRASVNERISVRLPARATRSLVFPAIRCPLVRPSISITSPLNRLSSSSSSTPLLQPLPTLQHPSRRAFLSQPLTQVDDPRLVFPMVMALIIGAIVALLAEESVDAAEKPMAKDLAAFRFAQGNVMCGSI